jgi:hypothetical protein
MTLNQIVALAGDAIFQQQCRAAAIGEAMAVIASPPTSHNRSDQKRWSLASSTIADGCTANLTLFAWGLAATPGFSAIVNDTGDQNDAAIASAMVSQWSNLAGVTGADVQVGS